MKINGATANVSTPINGASIERIPSAMLQQSNLEKAFASNSNILQKLTPQDSVAIFIDAQNSSPEHFEVAQQHLNNSIPSHSLTTIKRIYGDHSTLFITWDKSILRHKLHVPYHYPNKHLPNLHNADPLIIMDIMETLYSNPAKAYILVTGDGDFTPLVHKLKEAGKIVIGYGREKSTSNALSSACHYFVDTQELIDAENKRMMEEKERRQEEGKALAKKLAVEKRKKEETLILEELAKREKDAKDRWVQLDRLGNLIDSKKFGYKKLSQLFQSWAEVEIEKTKNGTFVRRISEIGKSTEMKQSSLIAAQKVILEQISKIDDKDTEGWVDMSLLGNSIDCKKFGYNRLLKLLQDIAEVETEKRESSMYVRTRPSDKQAYCHIEKGSTIGVLI